MKIKICGITTIEEIDFINQYKPDLVGFIFVEKSKRKVDINIAAELKNKLNKKIKSVGVFVNEEIKNIVDIININLIELIQLHGNETNEYIRRLRGKTNLPIIKAFKADENLEDNIKKSEANYILIDSYNKDSFGGMGKVFDWGLIPKTDKKIFLAGGLNINNIEDAIKKVHPYCLDINSGVETNGKKDKQKVEEIIKKIKGYNYE